MASDPPESERRSGNCVHGDGGFGDCAFENGGTGRTINVVDDVPTSAVPLRRPRTRSPRERGPRSAVSS